MKNNNIHQSYINKDEIDLLDLFFRFWGGRKTILKTVFVSILLGLFISYGSQKEYKVEIKLLPEISSKESGFSSVLRQYGGLLGGMNLEGFNLSDALNPSLYPDIVQSTPFLIQIMNTQIFIPSLDTTASLYVYLNDLKKTSLLGIIKKYSIGLPDTIKKIFRRKSDLKSDIVIDNGPIKLTLEMQNTLESLQKMIKADVNIKSGIITISAQFPEPEIAAQIIDKTLSYLTDYITDYRVQKAINNLNFIENQCEKARIEFYNAQVNLADFIDKNKNIISAHSESEKVRLQSQYDLSFNIYNGLSQQREQAKILVQKETPVFKVLNPAVVPLLKSHPKRALILIIMVILGIFVGLGILLASNYYNTHIKGKYNNV